MYMDGQKYDELESKLIMGAPLALFEVDWMLSICLSDMFFGIINHVFDKGMDEPLNIAKENAFNRLAILIARCILARYNADGVRYE